MTGGPPALRCYMNWLGLNGLPQASPDPLQAICAAGYDGVQLLQPLSLDLVREARALGLGVCGSGRVNECETAEELAREARDAGLECLTLHIGWGLEDDPQAHRLIEAVLAASDRCGMPLFAETHRATIFQDPWRAIQFSKRFPELKFNGDFSNWYTGSEFVYGGFERKMAFIAPILARTRFLHGRIGNPGCIQVDVGDGNVELHPYVAHFRALWTAVFAGFLDDPGAQSVIWFAPELLAADIYFARTFNGKEESDRWEQSLVLCQIATECFAQAKKEHAASLRQAASGNSSVA